VTVTCQLSLVRVVCREAEWCGDPFGRVYLFLVDFEVMWLVLMQQRSPALWSSF
jgi:hypothetical protein